MTAVFEHTISNILSGGRMTWKRCQKSGPQGFHSFGASVLVAQEINLTYTASNITKVITNSLS